jgi:hypothetical protein
MSRCGTLRRPRRTRCSIARSGVVGVEAEMRRHFGCGGRYVDTHVLVKYLCEEKKTGERGRRERKDRPCTTWHRGIQRLWVHQMPEENYRRISDGGIIRFR